MDIQSVYCKDDLPTWDELYEFYIKNMFDYDPNNPSHQEEDQYWKKPRRKVLLAFVCNQLNKMIFEDNINPLQFLRYTYGIDMNKVQFVLSPWELDSKEVLLNNYIPKIYTCKIPSTKQTSIFRIKEHPTIDIDTLDEIMVLSAVANDNCSISVIEKFKLFELIKFVLKDVIKYFENGIGWKDLQK